METTEFKLICCAIATIFGVELIIAIWLHDIKKLLMDFIALQKKEEKDADC